MSKVLVVSEEGRGGGALYRIVNISKATSGDIETVVVCPRSAERFIRKLENAGIKVIKSRLRPLSKSPLKAMAYILWFGVEIFQLCNIIKRENPDIVHANGSWQIKSIIASKIMGRKSIWHLNDTLQPKTILRTFGLLSNVPNGYLFASRRTLKYYSKHIKKSTFKYAVIPAPVNAHRFVFRNSRRVHKELQVATVAYINKNKGLDHLIDVAHLLRDRAVTFHVVGPVLTSQKGFYRRIKNKIEQLNLTNVGFHGYQEIQDNFFDSFDLYLCTSTNESSPTSVWEALSAGLPLVSTNVGDIKELLTDYNCGYSLDVGDVRGLAEKIITIIELDDIDYKAMSNEARRAATELFDVQVIASDYIRFYSEIISG